MSKADRYISQNALIKEILKIHGNLSTKNVGQAIWDTPTADVVEVVRCKDCKDYKAYGNGKAGICKNKKCRGLRYATDFCSFGERREG